MPSNSPNPLKTSAPQNADEIVIPDILPPKVDIVFKMLFGDKRNIDILKDFLKAVLHLGEGELKEIILIDPQIKRENVEDKLCVLDIKAELASGKRIDIEIQVKNTPDMRSRATYYDAKMIAEQVGIGGSYSDIKPAIMILIVDYPLILETEKCHSRFRMLEVEEHFPFNDLQEINVLDLTRIGVEKDMSLSDWLKFIGAKSEEDIMQATARNPVIRTALKRLKVISADRNKRLLYEARMKAQLDQRSFEDAARAEGEAIGEARGRVEGEAIGRAEGEAIGVARVLDLMAQGFTYEEISAKMGKE